MTNPGYIQTDLDLKFLVLYIMNRVAAPISPDQLLELCLCDEGVNYFNFQQAVTHLVETEHLTLERERYAITEKGRHNSHICESSLPFSVRRRCDRNLSVLNAQLRRDAQVKSSVTEREAGTYTVALQLNDDAGTLLKLELLTPSHTQAHRLAQQFNDHPEQVYNGVVNALLSDLEAE
ncbi:MAG: DUF4364 family protein [Ruminococcaceae bacterium]|nr:DUF4364 family protein [Oscillospiraceae bacterium]